MLRPHAHEDVARAHAYLRELGIPSEMKMDAGDPAEQIVAEATTGGYDVVVVGSRGHGTMGRLFLGSVSTEVVARRPLPGACRRSPHMTERIEPVAGACPPARPRQSHEPSAPNSRRATHAEALERPVCPNERHPALVPHSHDHHHGLVQLAACGVQRRALTVSITSKPGRTLSPSLQARAPNTSATKRSSYSHCSPIAPTPQASSWRR